MNWVSWFVWIVVHCISKNAIINGEWQRQQHALLATTLVGQFVSAFVASDVVHWRGQSCSVCARDTGHIWSVCLDGMYHATVAAVHAIWFAVESICIGFSFIRFIGFFCRINIYEHRFGMLGCDWQSCAFVQAHTAYGWMRPGTWQYYKSCILIR